MITRADAGDRLDHLLDLLLRDLGDLAHVALAGDHDAHDRARVDVELLHHRRLGAARSCERIVETLSRTSWAPTALFFSRRTGR